MSTEPRERMAELERAKAERESIRRWSADHDDEMGRMEAFAQGAVVLFAVAVIAAVLLIKGAL